MATESPETISIFDNFLKVWAIVGPVLAAVITAWWNRRNEVDNREYNRNREEEIENRKIKNQNLDKIIELKQKKREEIKRSLISFISLASECHNMNISNSLKNLTDSRIVEEHSRRIQALSDLFHELFLLSPPKEVLDKALSLLNFISTTPFQNYQNHSLNQELSQKLSNYKTGLLTSACTYLNQEDSNILSSLGK